MAPGSRSTRSERSSTPVPQPSASACIGFSKSYDGGIPMMPHDDSDLRLLERDLGRIARPRDGDERIRLAVREQLAGRMRPRPRRRLSVRIAIGSTALAGATAAIALVVLVATNGSEGPAVANAAIVHHALKAVTPLRHKVLHVKVVGVQNGVPVMAETWQETSAPYAIRGIKGGGGHVGEFGDNGTTSFRYDAGSNTIYEHPDSSHLTF